MRPNIKKLLKKIKKEEREKKMSGVYEKIALGVMLAGVVFIGIQLIDLRVKTAFFIERSKLYENNLQHPLNRQILPNRAYTEQNIQDKIREQAGIYGIDAEQALMIAECESQFGKYLYNPKSSAKGIYQFIDKTWNNYCEGDVLNEDDNIRCFMEKYKTNPEWWSSCE